MTCLLPTWRADAFDGDVNEVAHLPGSRGVADFVEEVFEDLCAVGRVGDFGVELDAVEGLSEVCRWQRGGRWGWRRGGGSRCRGFGPDRRGSSRRWCPGARPA